MLFGLNWVWLGTFWVGELAFSGRTELFTENALIAILYFQIFNNVWFTIKYILLYGSFANDIAYKISDGNFAILMIVDDLESPINLNVSDNFETIRQKCRFSRRTKTAFEFHL